MQLDLLRAKGRRVERQRRTLMAALEESGYDILHSSPGQLKEESGEKDSPRKVLQVDDTLAYWFQGWFKTWSSQEPTWKHLEELKSVCSHL